MRKILTPPIYSKGDYRLDPEGISGPGVFLYAHQIADRDRELPECARWPLLFAATVPGFDPDSFCDVLWHALARKRIPEADKPSRGDTLRESKMLRRIADNSRVRTSKKFSYQSDSLQNKMEQ